MFEFLDAKFLQAMNEIGEYGHAKYGAESFHTRALVGDTSRTLERTGDEVIARHALEHFLAYLNDIPHDYFNTRRHQLAAVAFNAMMEFHFAGLAKEEFVCSVSPDGKCAASKMEGLAVCSALCIQRQKCGVQ